MIGTGPGLIEIEVLESSGSYVKLGIRATKEVPVARKEIYVTAQENRAAARNTNASLDGLIQSLKTKL